LSFNDRRKTAVIDEFDACDSAASDIIKGAFHRYGISNLKERVAAALKLVAESSLIASEKPVRHSLPVIRTGVVDADRVDGLI
jgi:DNA replicative helicase MCM subunit Mcm2 (Cdc46/Mcm family)